MLSGEQFLEQLRGALKHLYDPYVLGRSPLIALFGLQNQPDAIPALQKILTEAIERLEPRGGAGNNTQSQLVYDLLTYRYVQQFSQEEVASQLGMSVRHMRREQNAATYMLAAQLWQDQRLSERAFDAPARPPEGEPEAEKHEQEEARDGNELAFLSESGGAEAVDFCRLLDTVLALARPLAERHGTSILSSGADARPPRDNGASAGLPQVVVQPMALRQLLLTLFSIALARSTPGSGQPVTLKTGMENGALSISMRVEAARPGSLPASATEKSNLEMAYRLAEICASKLTFHQDADTGAMSIQFSLPAQPRYAVLVIDDNPDNAHLMEHFTGGTQYRLRGTQDPYSALELVEREQPDLIILDVMMPGIDGWELLGRLRSHPQTSAIPVVVCTILAQEELALTLGASGFLHKPITRQSLLRELDLQAALLAKESR
jgi:CheY-like chemotaxis protein/AraC-like DNA-binding protein